MSEDDDDIVIVLHSTDIKVTNRGQLLQEKWLFKKKKGHLKIHPHCYNYKNQRNILVLEVTDEKAHDGQIMPQLIELFEKKKQEQY
jgi:hypothetical protein